MLRSAATAEAQLQHELGVLIRCLSAVSGVHFAEMLASDFFMDFCGKGEGNRRFARHLAALFAAAEHNSSRGRNSAVVESNEACVVASAAMVLAVRVRTCVPAWRACVACLRGVPACVACVRACVVTHTTSPRM